MSLGKYFLTVMYLNIYYVYFIVSKFQGETKTIKEILTTTKAWWSQCFVSQGKTKYKKYIKALLIELVPFISVTTHWSVFKLVSHLVAPDILIEYECWLLCSYSPNWCLTVWVELYKELKLSAQSHIDRLGRSVYTFVILVFLWGLLTTTTKNIEHSHSHPVDHNR